MGWLEDCRGLDSCRPTRRCRVVTPAVVSQAASGRVTASWAEGCGEEAECLPEASASRVASQRPVLLGVPGTFGNLFLNTSPVRRHLLVLL